MEWHFVDAKLASCFADQRSRKRAFGDVRAKRIEVRLAQLSAARNLEELRNVPGHWHELSSNYAGYLACDLDGPYRLIFAPTKWEKRDDGGLDWSKVTKIVIVGIVDYHGKN